MKYEPIVWLKKSRKKCPHCKGTGRGGCGCGNPMCGGCLFCFNTGRVMVRDEKKMAEDRRERRNELARARRKARK